MARIGLGSFRRDLRGNRNVSRLFDTSLADGGGGGACASWLYIKPLGEVSGNSAVSLAT